MIYFLHRTIHEKCCHQPNRTCKKHVTNNEENKLTLKVEATTEFDKQSNATTQTSSRVKPISKNHSNERVHYTRREQGMTPGNSGVEYVDKNYYDYVDDTSITTRPNFSYGAQYRNVNLSSNAPTEYYDN